MINIHNGSHAGPDSRSLILYTRDFPFGKGEASFILPELSFLTRAFDVTIVTKNTSGAMTSNIPSDIRVVRVPPRTERTLINLFATLCDPLLRREIKRLIKAGELTLSRAFIAFKELAAANQFMKKLRGQKVIKMDGGQVHYSYWYDQTVIGLCRYKDRLGDGKIVTRMHRCDLYALNKEKYLPFRQMLDGHINACVFISREGRDYYCAHNALKKKPHHRVFYLGVPNDGVPKHYGGFNGTVRLVSCSYLSPVKRVGKIIDVIAAIKNYPVEWTHIGNGVLDDEMRAYAEKTLRRCPNIRWDFQGYRTTAEIYDLYRRKTFDFFINLSSSEGLPVSFMEAMSFGIPVVSNLTGGVGEILDEHCALLVGLEDTPDMIAAEIVRFVNQQPDTLALYRYNACRAWKNNFDAHVNYSRFVDYLLTL